MAKKGAYCLDIRNMTGGEKYNLTAEQRAFLEKFMTFCQTDCDFVFPPIPVVLVTEDEAEKYVRENNDIIDGIYQDEGETPPAAKVCILGYYTKDDLSFQVVIQQDVLIGTDGNVISVGEKVQEDPVVITGPLVVIFPERIFKEAAGAPFNGDVNLLLTKVILHEFGHALMDVAPDDPANSVKRDLFYLWMEESMANVVVMTCFNVWNKTCFGKNSFGMVKKFIAMQPEYYKFSLDLHKYGIIHWWAWCDYKRRPVEIRPPHEHGYDRNQYEIKPWHDVERWLYRDEDCVAERSDMFCLIPDDLEHDLKQWCVHNPGKQAGFKQVWYLLGRSIMRRHMGRMHGLPPDYNRGLPWSLKVLLSTVLQQPLFCYSFRRKKQARNVFECFPRESVESVYAIPSGITEITPHAFAGCRTLTQITIPKGVKAIGNGAFYYCDKLAQIKLPSGLTEIGDNTFYGCRTLTQITIPKGVKAIGNGAFYYCNKLAQIKLPAGLKEIGEDAFNSCSKLTRVTIPSGVKTIGRDTFKNCYELMQIKLQAGIKVIGNGAFYYCNELAQIKFPSSVKEIGDKAFYCCCNLTQIVLPSSVRTIGASAFERCTGLTQIRLPSSIKRIGSAVFCDCSELPDIVVDNKNQNYISLDGVVFNKKRSKLVCCPSGRSGVYDIPDGIREIGDNAFSSCCGLTQVALPASVKKIGDNAFSLCRSLTQITILPGIKEIGSSAFSRCSSLTQIAIPSSVKKINRGAFWSCEALTDIKIPASIRKIEINLFSGCCRLTQIIIPSSVQEICLGAFSCKNLTRLYFEGDAPAFSDDIFHNPWHEECDAVSVSVYHREGRKGWGPEFCGRLTKIWE